MWSRYLFRHESQLIDEASLLLCMGYVREEGARWNDGEKQMKRDGGKGMAREWCWETILTPSKL